MAKCRPTMRLSIRTVVLGVASFLVLGVASFLVLGCAGAGPSDGPAVSEAPRLRVVTTTTVFADIVRNVAGSDVAVDPIIPAGVGPEDYEPSPDDARKLAGADLIVSNGVGLDDWLDGLIEAAGENGAARLVLGEGIPAIIVDGEPNPHFWLDPSLVVAYYLPAISAELAALDPERADDYDRRRATYAARIEALDVADRQALETIPEASRKLVTAHDAFPYFAAHYGFEVVGVVLSNVGQEPTAAEFGALVETVKSAGVRAIFSESQSNSKLSQALADEAGITTVTTLYNDTLGPPPADSYLGMLAWNVAEIVKALR